MKLIKLKTMNEAIEDMNTGYNNMDTQLVNKNTTTQGEAPIVYTDAIKRHIEKRERIKDNLKDNLKLSKELVDENQPDSHNKLPERDKLRRLKLSEAFNKEEFKSKIYNMLSAVAEGYHKNGVDLTADDFNTALEWFLIKFADEAEWSFTDTLNEEVIKDEKGREVDLDEVDPFDLVMDTITATGRQVIPAGKSTPVCYAGLYDYNKIGMDKNDNITVTVNNKEELDPGVEFAKDYSIEYSIKQLQSGRWRLILDPWTVDMVKLYPDRNKFCIVGPYKQGVEKKNR